MKFEKQDQMEATQAILLLYLVIKPLEIRRLLVLTLLQLNSLI